MFPDYKGLGKKYQTQKPKGRCGNYPFVGFDYQPHSVSVMKLCIPVNYLCFRVYPAKYLGGLSDLIYAQKEFAFAA